MGLRKEQETDLAYVGYTNLATKQSLVSSLELSK